LTHLAFDLLACRCLEKAFGASLWQTVFIANATSLPEMRTPGVVRAMTPVLRRHRCNSRDLLRGILLFLEDGKRFFGGFVIALATRDLPIGILVWSVNVEAHDKSLLFKGLNFPSID
jgi:hypothetical protein